MKKILLTLTAIILLISCSSPEDMAKKLIIQHLIDNLKDPSSYSSVSYEKLDSTFAELTHIGNNYKGEFNGWEMKHSYRAKNSFGALGTYTQGFYFDKGITKITEVCTIKQDSSLINKHANNAHNENTIPPMKPKALGDIKDFYKFLAIKSGEHEKLINDIQRDEYALKYEKTLSLYIDSVGLFINCQGEISDISTRKQDNKTFLTFTITCDNSKYNKVKEYRKVYLFCTHIIDGDDVSNDYIYNTIKNIANNSTVYFDGFINTKNNDKVNYYEKALMNWRNFDFPEYNFCIIDISSNKKQNRPLSENMRKVINLTYETNEPLKKQYMGIITKEESDLQFNKIIPKLDEAKSLLSEDEVLYIQRLSAGLVYNFLLGN